MARIYKAYPWLFHGPHPPSCAQGMCFGPQTLVKQRNKSLSEGEPDFAQALADLRQFSRIKVAPFELT